MIFSPVTLIGTVSVEVCIFLVENMKFAPKDCRFPGTSYDKMC